MAITIALDAMGGDFGPQVVVPASLQMLEEQADLSLTLVGDQSTITEELKAHGANVGERLKIHHASQRVEMDEHPSQALRYKKDSSMRVAINLVKEDSAQACVSAGNTGALMATARYVLKTLPGIDRPAIIKTLPTIKGQTHMLDLGANVDTEAENLYQFAIMGATQVAAVDGISHPSVGLLNIGEEEIKGNEQVRKAATMLTNSDINYIGFVEGDDIYQGTADVVVCDGFVGNVALKTSEGVAKMVSHFLKQAFTRTPLARLMALIARPALKDFGRRIDPRRYNGASIVGLQGIVVKSHGGADTFAFANAIREAIVEVRQGVPLRISKQLETRLMERRVG